MNKLIWIAYLICGTTYAQVMVDAPVILEGEVPEDKQFLGLPFSEAPNDVLVTGTEQAGAFRVLTELQGNVWEAEVPALVDQPEAGMHLLVLSPMASPGPIRIRVNGSEPFPIWKTPGILLDGAEIPEGAALSIVLDGTAFHLLNGSTYMKRPCMPGTVQVTEHYCIEASKRSAADLFQAFSSCNASGMRLCSWGEFILACQRAGEIGMLNPTSSWEWTGDASNENNCARVVGVGSCLSAGNSFASGSTPRNFRCCHSR